MNRVVVLPELARKAAALGGEPETGFQQLLAELGEEILRDKSPQLMEYALGFQLVDRDQDNKRAVGVFGFQLPEQLCYATIFFMNNKIKGHELLYLVDRELFCPLKENWVNYLLRRSNFNLGNSTDSAPVRRRAKTPELYDYSDPPITKYSSHWRKIASSFIGHVGNNPNSRYGDLDQQLDLQTALEKDPHGLAMLKRSCDRYPALRQAFEHFYPASAMRKIAGQAMVRSLTDRPNLPAKKAADALLIVQSTDYELVPAESKEQAQLDGFAIVDNRSDDDVCCAFEQKYSSWTNPIRDGVYEVLLADGRVKTLAAVRNIYGSSRGWFLAPVGDKDSDVVTAHQDTTNSRIFVRSAEPDLDTLQDWFTSLPAVSKKSLSPDSSYVIMTQRAGSINSVSVRIVHELEDGFYSIDSYPTVCAPPSSGNAVRKRRDIEYEPPISLPNTDNDENRYLRIDAEASEIHKVGNILVVPATARVAKKWESYDTDYGRVPERFSLGDPVSIMSVLRGEAPTLKLASWVDEISINGGKRMARADALISLVRDFSLREKTARDMLKRADKSGVLDGVACEFILFRPKKANRDSLLDPYASRENEEPAMSQHTRTEARIVDDGRPRGGSYGIGANDDMLPQESAQLAMQAAQLGEKQLFDVSVLSGLNRRTDIDTIIEDNARALIPAMNRLGSTIYVFYWHNDDFADRYGSSALPELEDALRNTFEMIGDTVLWLQERDIGMGLPLRRPDLSQTAGA